MRARIALVVVLAAALVGVLWLLPSRQRRAASVAVVTESAGAAASSLAPAEAETRDARAELPPGAVAGPSDAAARPAATGLRYRVRVVDSRRFPVAGATVELLFPRSGAFRTTSDEHGEAVMSVPRPPEQENGIVRAAHGERACIESCRLPPAGEPLWEPLRPDEIDLGSLPLGETHAVTVRVLRDGRPAAGVSVAAEARKLVALARATTDGDGRARFAGLPADWIVFHARAADADGWTGAILPDPELAEVEVALEPLRTLLVRVQERKSARPLAGAIVGIREIAEEPRLPWREYHGGSSREVELEVPPTDASGATRVSGLSARSTYVVRARLREDPREHSAQSEVAAAGQNEVVFEFGSRTPKTMRWPVVAGELPVPPEGTTFELKALDSGQTLLPPPWAGRMEHGEIVVEGWWGYPIFWFRAPDGALALGDGKFAPISFQRPRRVAVLLRRADGTPAGGVQLGIEAQSFDPNGNLAMTDEEGRAEFRGLKAGRGKISAPALGISLGRVDFEADDVSVELALPGPRSLHLRVRIGDEPRLPGRYFVWTDDEPRVRVVREHPERGEIELEFSAVEPAAFVLHFSGQGFREVTRTIEPATAGRALVVELDLEPACTLVAEVFSALGAPGAVSGEHWNEEAREWQYVDDLEVPNGSGGTYRFEGLGPGRFRVAGENGQVSDEVTLGPSRPVGRVRLVLHATVTISGRVVGPPELVPEQASIQVAGEGLVDEWERSVDKDGRFTLRLPAGSRAFLTVRHPFLTGEGPVEALDGAVLRLRHGDEVQIPLGNSFGKAPRSLRLRVLRFAGEPGGTPLSTHTASIVDGVARFGDVPQGKWTFWIDPGWRFVPAVLRDVEVGAGVTRLPEPSWTRGSTLRVRVIPRPGMELPDVRASTQFEGEPRFSRSALARAGEGVLELLGLAAGTYEVHLQCWLAEPPEQSRALEVDGKNDVEWTLDLR